MSQDATMKTPYREIRALHDEACITVYQAYSAEIASPAVRQQKLSASPAFKPGRMTWIKPSWSWMMYRSGYATKDARQERILAIRMRHEHFVHLLRLSSLSSSEGHNGMTAEAKAKPVRVQWDPERNPKLGVLPYRSIQIGIAGALSEEWATNWIESITDVTDQATRLKQAIDVEPDISVNEIISRGLVPVETVYELPESLQKHLGMI